MTDEQKSKPSPTERVKDPPEASAEDVLRALASHLFVLRQKLSEVRAPMPGGLSEGDEAAVKLRRADLAGSAAMVHGATRAMALVARQTRLITHEQYAQHILAVEELVG